MRLKPTSNFVVPNQDVEDGDLITILDEGEYEESRFDDDKQLVFTVRVPSGQKKKLSLNNTSQRNLVQGFCPKSELRDGIIESKHFVDKEAKVNIVKEDVFGKERDVIYLKPAGEEKATPRISNREAPPEFSI